MSTRTAKYVMKHFQVIVKQMLETDWWWLKMPKHSLNTDWRWMAGARSGSLVDGPDRAPVPFHICAGKNSGNTSRNACDKNCFCLWFFGDFFSFAIIGDRIVEMEMLNIGSEERERFKTGPQPKLSQEHCDYQCMVQVWTIHHTLQGFDC